jgi:hypothetical protein
MFPTPRTTRPLPNAKWPSLLGFAALLLPAIAIAQPTPPSADNQNGNRNNSTAEERTTIDALRARSSSNGGYVNGGGSGGGSAFSPDPRNNATKPEDRTTPPLSSQEAQLNAARAEIRSLSAALEQANRRLADMERKLATQHSDPNAVLPPQTSGDLAPGTPRGFFQPPVGLPSISSAAVPAAPPAPAVPGQPPMPQIMRPPAPFVAPGAMRPGADRFINSNNPNLEQRLDSLENQLLALHEEIRDTMKQIHKPQSHQPSPDLQPFQPPTAPPTPAPPAGRQ